MSVIVDARELVIRASTLKVVSAPTRQDAAELWSLIRSTRKQAEEDQEIVCGPLKQTYEDARAPFLTLRKECELWEGKLQAAMAHFDREQDRLARVEQERLQAMVDKKNEKIIAKADAKGIEPVLRAAPVVQATPKSLATQGGTSQLRASKKVYKVKTLATKIDASLPEVEKLLKDFPKLFVLDQVAFNALAKTGMLDSRGDVEIDETFVYSQRA